MQKGRRASENNNLRLFLICFALSGGVILLLSVIGALVASGLDDPTGSLGLISLAVMLISAVISGVFSARIKGEGALGFSALVAMAVVLVMLLINLILCAGEVSLSAFMNYACFFGVAVMSAFVGRKRERHIRHRH